MVAHQDIKFKSIDDQINQYLPVAYQFVDDHILEWRLDHDVDLEVTNHVLRVRIQDGTIKNYTQDVLALCKNQHTDGGWGNKRDDKESMLRSTSFCVQMLLRANRILNNQYVQDTIIKGLDYIVGQQLDDGSWRDATWHYLDAVSTSVGTLIFVMNEAFVNERYKNALKKGMEFTISERHENGLWYYKPTGSPVTITAHLLQKCAIYYGGSEINDQSIRELIKLQDEEGHWDNANTDHTCDAIRSMMLTASRSLDKSLIPEVFASACKAINWLTAISQSIGGGLGDRPGDKAHVERTCDGIDAMLKLRQFAADNTQMIKFWH